METPNYFVEFNGYDYVVLLGVQVVAAFATMDEAFNAKRAFQDKPSMASYDKIPPAMRAAKQLYHPQNNSC